MEKEIFENDMTVFCVTAESFPEGIKETFDKLKPLFKIKSKRKVFGISWAESGRIVYKAGAEMAGEDDAEYSGFETMILRKGNYICATINDFMNNIPKIGTTFTELLKYPGIDPNGYCIEWYFNPNDVKCMVRLKD